MKNKLLLALVLLVVGFVNAVQESVEKDPSIIIVVIEDETPLVEISKEERILMANLEFFKEVIAVSQDPSFSEVCDLDKKGNEIRQRMFGFLSDCSKNKDCINRMSEFNSLVRESDEHRSEIHRIVRGMREKGHNFSTIHAAIRYDSCRNSLSEPQK